jgi:hypothetical protein
MAVLPIAILLLILVPVLGGAAGIALFVVGLVKKKPAMWGSGIGLAVVSLLVVVVGVVAAGFLGWRTARSAAQQAVTLAAANRQTAALAVESEIFRVCTGLDLPQGSSVLGAAKITDARLALRRCYFLKLGVQPAFDNFLRKHFERRDWKDVEKTLTRKPTPPVDLWAPADLRNKTYYTRTYRTGPNAPERMVTTIVHDPNAGVAYFVSVREETE